MSVAGPRDPMVESEQTAEHPIGAGLAEGQAESLLRRATYASVGLAILLALVKLAAWLLTGSVAMLASFVDSVLDVVASGVNLVAVRHALRPADRQHRFGHGKAEPLAGLIQALVVGASVVFLLSEAGERLIHPAPVEHGAAGIAVMLFAMAATFALILFQRHVVRKTGSIAIAADSLHFRADLVVNLSVIVALVLSTSLGLDYLDPLFAIGIAAYVLYSVWSLIRSSFDMLMDREFPDEVRARIREIAMSHPDVLDMHDMRTRSAGVNSFIQLHIELKGDISLKRAHVIADEVEDEIREAFPNTDIIIHQDPEGIVEKRAVFQ